MKENVYLVEWVEECIYVDVLNKLMINNIESRCAVQKSEDLLKLVNITLISIRK